MSIIFGSHLKRPHRHCKFLCNGVKKQIPKLLPYLSIACIIDVSAIKYHLRVVGVENEQRERFNAGDVSLRDVIVA
jgi:hypothetical protein